MGCSPLNGQFFSHIGQISGFKNVVQIREIEASGTAEVVDPERC
jgi:hypothetical protein